MDHPPDPKTFIDEKTVLIVRDCHSTGAAGPESDEWMDGLSAAELLMQFGIDPHVVIVPDGKMRTPEGEDYSLPLSDTSGVSSSSEGSKSSGSDDSSVTDASGEETSKVKVDRHKTATKEDQNKD